MDNLEQLKQFFIADRYAMFSKIEIVSVEEGTCVCKMPIEDMHLNAGNVVQGGAIFTLADFAFAVGANSLGNLTVTLSSNINFISAPKGGMLIATAESISVKRSIVVYEVTVTDDEGVLVAVMRNTGFVKQKRD